ncbi:MAG: MotA/TolQ/ExbB proton channel family protein [Polyangiaceae bacterium]
MNIVHAINGLTQMGAAWVLWLLVALSVVGLAVAVERAVYLFGSRDDIAALTRDLALSLGRGETDKARHRLEESPSFEARIARAALDSDSAEAARERIARESALTRIDLERRLVFLGTLGNNAPFVGLLGTVIGIVRAFQALGAGAGQVSAGLMAEIGEALVATAFGLLVALPAVACFNYFQRVIRTRLARGDALSREVLAHLESQALVREA